MRNLARELELSPNLNIELNNVEVLSDAVDSMIEKLGPNSPVLVWLLDYIDERIADDKRWNVSDEIKSFGRNIFDEGYIEKGDGLRRRLRDPNVIHNYRKTLKEMETAALEQMKEFAQQFENVLSSQSLKPTDLKNGAKGIGSYFNKLKNGILGDEIVNATVIKCLDDETKLGCKNIKTIYGYYIVGFFHLNATSTKCRTISLTQQSNSEQLPTVDTAPEQSPAFNQY